MNGEQNGRILKLVELILFSLMLVRAALAGESNSYPEYKKKIQAIRQILGYPMVTAQDLFNDTNFIAIYENPQKYVDRAVKFLSESNSYDCKMVVVYSLQRLPLKTYVEYETRMLHLADSGQLSKEVLNRAVFPGLEWSRKLQLHFEQPDVKKLLDEMARSDCITKENKEYIQEIFSGKARRDINDFMDSGAMPNHE